MEITRRLYIYYNLWNLWNWGSTALFVIVSHNIKIKKNVDKFSKVLKKIPEYLKKSPNKAPQQKAVHQSRWKWVWDGIIFHLPQIKKKWDGYV